MVGTGFIGLGADEQSATMALLPQHQQFDRDAKPVGSPTLSSMRKPGV